MVIVKFVCILYFLLPKLVRFLNSFVEEWTFFLLTGKGKDRPVIIQWNNLLSPAGVTSVVLKYCSDISVNSHSLNVRTGIAVLTSVFCDVFYSLPSALCLGKKKNSGKQNFKSCSTSLSHSSSQCLLLQCMMRRH